LQLLGSRQAAKWIFVRDFCLKVGVPCGELKASVFAIWLPDPLAHDAYAVLIFYDDDTKWSMAAHYNRQRLQKSTSATDARTASSASVPAS
jgi:hypothetical protein